MSFPDDTSPPDTLWNTMHAEKGDLTRRVENYARLTLPYICPPDGSKNTEQVRGDVVIGPRLVNHLANKIVDTMFPHDRPFFTVTLTAEARNRLRKELGDNQEAAFAEAVRTETAAVEQAAMRSMDLTLYRPQAVEAVKHMEISGNVLIRRLPEGRRVVYGIKDYSIRRRIDGQPREIMLRDAKKFADLPAGLQARVLERHPLKKSDEDCVLYTHYLKTGARWDMRQAVDDVLVHDGVSYNPRDLPVLPLAWNLARGENYGRGPVEDHISGFHNIDVCTLAMIEMAGIMADVKFLVDPASILDVAELNASPRGSYHSGRKDDITVPDGVRNLAIDTIDALVNGWERELSQAFLLNSPSVRDAERVTAEEIRFVAQELEAAFGGLYSRLAIEWQKHEAEFALSKIDFQKDIGGRLDVFEVLITTGLESLSREGQLTNLRRATADLQMLDAVPEDLRGVINPRKFASFVYTNHTVPFTEFLYTQEELQQNQQAQMQQQQELANIQANANVQQAAGERAVKESTA